MIAPHRLRTIHVSHHKLAYSDDPAQGDSKSEIGALCLWGAVQSIINGPAQALYADSIETGERSRYFTYAFSLCMVASVLGPVVAILLFVVHSDSWSPATLRTVFLVGQFLELFA